MSFSINSNPSISFPKQYNTRDGSKKRSIAWKYFKLDGKAVHCNVKNGRGVECGSINITETLQ